MTGDCHVRFCERLRGETPLCLLGGFFKKKVQLPEKPDNKLFSLRLLRLCGSSNSPLRAMFFLDFVPHFTYIMNWIYCKSLSINPTPTQST